MRRAMAAWSSPMVGRRAMSCPHVPAPASWGGQYACARRARSSSRGGLPDEGCAMSSSEIPPGYNTPIPARITTPGRVTTRIGTLEFTDGIPTPDTTALLYDHLDFQRAVDVFLRCIPAASLEAMRRGQSDTGLEACHQVGITDELLGSNPLYLTSPWMPANVHGATSGTGGIRTLGPVRAVRFQGGCIRPLCHRSGLEGSAGAPSPCPRFARAGGRPGSLCCGIRHPWRGARAAEWGALLRR